MFFTRLLSSIVLVILTLAVLFAGGPLLAVVLMLISIVAFFELTRACGVHSGMKKVNALELAGILGIIAYYAAMQLTRIEGIMNFAIIISFLGIMFVYVFAFPIFRSSQVMVTFFSFIYAPVLLSFIYRTRSLPHGIYLVWLIFISSWICDTFAYLSGMLLGKHKLAPQLSPKKSIEGAIGGVLGAALVGALFGWLVVGSRMEQQGLIWIFTVIGGFGAVISQLGDLAASAIKRNHEIKDYGELIPGHGGVMDRFDSVIFAAPMIYYLSVFFLQ